MKWMYHYVVIDKANTLIDYHQQGSIVYAGKPWTTKSQENNNHAFRQRLMNYLNTGNYNRRYLKYGESYGYGLDGVGSTITDYATGLALGSKFSPAYGFHVFTNGKKEYTLLQVKDLDTSKVKFTEQNTNFKTITLEIGYGVQYLGNSISARQKLSKEYKQYHFDTLLERLPSLLK